MARALLAMSALSCACQAELGVGDVLVDGGGRDAGIPSITADAPTSLGPWGAPTAIPGASSPTFVEDDSTLSSNTLELFYKSNASGNFDLYTMTRASASASWGAPVALTALNSAGAEESPRLSSDNLTLYFGRDGDIYRATRASVGQPWSAPSPVTALNTAAYEKWADVCDSGYAIVSRDAGVTNQDLFEGTLTGGATTALGGLNSASQEQGTMLSRDCLRVYYQSNAAGTFDIYVATRATASSAWSSPTALPDFNTTTSNEEDPWLSADQRVFVYASNVNGTKDVFIATR